MKKVKEVIGLQPVTQEVTAPSSLEERDGSYLARQAGLQTVQTSMRGILRKNENTPQRKRLLGE
ncbi:MAG: hypothetical protein J6Y03_04970 [Alphaproteobacteria bacterium]|nr:hypothetical protein [Alphaproteobacteria bacterium]